MVLIHLSFLLQESQSRPDPTCPMTLSTKSGTWRNPLGVVAPPGVATGGLSRKLSSDTTCMDVPLEKGVNRIFTPVKEYLILLSFYRILL